MLLYKQETLTRSGYITLLCTLSKGQIVPRTSLIHSWKRSNNPKNTCSGNEDKDDSLSLTNSIPPSHTVYVCA